MTQIFKERDYRIQILLMIVTLGLYIPYWFIVTSFSLRKLNVGCPNPYILIVFAPIAIILEVLNYFEIIIGDVYRYSSAIPLFVIALYYIYYLRAAYRATKTEFGPFFLFHFTLWPYAVLYLQGQYNNATVFNLSKEEVNDSNLKESGELEIKAKNYIEQHKNDFSKESIKKQLINTGLNKEKVENYMIKYY